MRVGLNPGSRPPTTVTLAWGHPTSRTRLTPIQAARSTDGRSSPVSLTLSDCVTAGARRSRCQLAFTSGLRPGLSQRQLNMIVIGGAIGAIVRRVWCVAYSVTGPAAFRPMWRGALIVLVMRMLGDGRQSVDLERSPTTRQSPAAGRLSAGWLYRGTSG